MKNNGYLFNYKSKYGEVGKKVHLKKDFEWDTSKLKKVSIFDLYRGWSLKAAIQDIWNARIDHLKHNLYPDWIKKQFNNSKEK